MNASPCASHRQVLAHGGEDTLQGPVHGGQVLDGEAEGARRGALQLVRLHRGDGGAPARLVAHLEGWRAVLFGWVIYYPV